MASNGFLEFVDTSETPVSPTPPHATVVMRPVLSSASFNIFQIMKQVVVLPLVPVTPMTWSFLAGKPYLMPARRALIK